MTTLLLSARTSADNQALWRAAIARGWSVERVRGLTVPEIADDEIVLYVEALYAPAIAKSLGLRLLDAPIDWLARLPYELTRRSVRVSTAGEARLVSEPTFIKPPNDKSFAAKVYAQGSDLPDHVADDEAVLLAEPVAWEAEFRCFCLEGKVHAVSPYLRNGVLARETNFDATEEELTAARSFAESVLLQAAGFTPPAVVMDVGQIRGRGWGVVEANGAWGAGIYGCDPSGVLDVIRHAVVCVGVPCPRPCEGMRSEECQ